MTFMKGKRCSRSYQLTLTPLESLTLVQALGEYEAKEDRLAEDREEAYQLRQKISRMTRRAFND